MKLLYTLIILFAFSFAEDIYPNFSSPKKQFKFEKERIYIDEVEEKEQIIEGGGSEFNVWALYNNVLPDYLQQPTLRQGNISTRYTYRYNFEITQNNKQLNEVDLLYAVGLKDEADEIIKSHERELKNFNKKHTKKQIKKMSYMPVYIATISSIIFGRINDIKNKPNDPPDIYLVFCVASLTYGVVKWYTIFRNNQEFIEAPSAPILQQTMSSKQLTAIAESYNRQVYKQIQSSY